MLFINIKLKFETRTLDFHQLIITIFKVKQDKLLPRIIKYRDVNNSIFIELKAILMELLIKVALLKTKYLRANYS